MWKYRNIEEKEVEAKKNLVEKIFQELGSEKLVITRELQEKMSTDEYSYVGNWIDERPIYIYENQYYHVNAIYFDEAPCIVIEWAESLEETMKNCMEDSSVFLYTISEEEVYQEVRYLLEIEPYPDDYS